MTPPSQPPDDVDVIVVVVDTPTLRQTVEEATSRLAGAGSTHLLALERDGIAPERTVSLLRDASRWASRSRSDRDRTDGVVRAGRTVAGRWPEPDDVAETVVSYADRHGIDRVVVPADFERAVAGVSSDALVTALRETGVAEATVGHVARPAIHRRLFVAGSVASTGALFVLSLTFYFVLAGGVDTFEVVTGVATAGLVAATFRRVTFATPPSPLRSGRRVVRWCLYVPYLLWEVAKANLAIAGIVLHPRLPIDPKLVSYPTSLRGELALTTFANSVTLTPGTLTVDVEDDGSLLVHTLTGDSRADLLEGSLERAVQFVFGGADSGTDRPRSAIDAEGSDD
jgi:multisubunit Na+/H+ antiporter MnhE subunit